MSTQERLIEILVKEYQLPPDKLQPDARLDQLGVDSLGVMELLFKIEDEFKIEVPAEQVQLSTVGEVVAYIEGLIAQQVSASAPQQARS